LDHELRFVVDDGVKYLERYRLAPSERHIRQPWMAGEAQYMGTTLVHHVRATAETAEGLQRQLGYIEGVRSGIDLLDQSLLVGRLLATTGTGCRRARHACRDVVLDQVFGCPELVVRR